MDTVYLTREGLEKLRRELETLVKEVRPEALRQLSTAREHGDLSENAEYHAARERLAEIDRKIGALQNQMARVEILDEEAIRTDEVRILTRVALLNLDTRQELVYTLVDPLQSDPRNHLISVKSPIGRGLLGARLGQEVTIHTPSGQIRMRVLKIEPAQGL